MEDRNPCENGAQRNYQRHHLECLLKTGDQTTVLSSSPLPFIYIYIFIYICYNIHMYNIHEYILKYKLFID